jgi:hypothetical protein
MVRFPAGAKDFYLIHSDQTCSGGPPSLQQNGYRVLFCRGKSGRCVKLNAHLRLLPMSRIMELYLHSPYAFMADHSGRAV